MATGMERKEVDNSSDIFWSREPINGPRGTRKNPAIVPSFNTSRCVGLETEHGVIWFKLDKGPLHLVADQYFKCGAPPPVLSVKAVSCTLSRPFAIRCAGSNSWTAATIERGGERGGLPACLLQIGRSGLGHFLTSYRPSVPGPCAPTSDSDVDPRPTPRRRVASLAAGDVN